MNKLTLFFLLLVKISLSQNQYSLDGNATIYAIPSGGLISVKTTNEKAYLKHFDANGSITWFDSLSFPIPVTNVHFSDIERFKNTDEYVVCMFTDVTPETPYWQGFTNDSLVFLFTKINMSTHQIGAQNMVQFACKGIDFVSINDSSIYFLLADFSSNVSPFNQSTNLLNSAMNISSVAPSDSVLTNSWGWNIEAFNDTIYRHQTIDGYHEMTKFDLQMSAQSFLGNQYVSGENFNEICFSEIINKDSLFVFVEGTTSGSYAVKWRMDWLDLSLNSIHDTIINSPLTDNFPIRYYTNYFNVALDKKNKQIVVLSSANSFNTLQKIFIYDYNFQYVCEIPIINGPNLQKSLIELNDQVYLKLTNSAQTNLILVSCAMLELNEVGNKQHTFNIFPNPTTNNLTISEIPLFLIGSKGIITDINGKQILDFQITQQQQQIDCSTLKKGVYFLRIGEENQKIIIE